MKPSCVSGVSGSRRLCEVHQMLQEVKGCSGHVTSHTLLHTLPCVNVSVQQETRGKNLRLKSKQCRVCSEEKKKITGNQNLSSSSPQKEEISGQEMSADARVQGFLHF